MSQVIQIDHISRLACNALYNVPFQILPVDDHHISIIRLPKEPSLVQKQISIPVSGAHGSAVYHADAKHPVEQYKYHAQVCTDDQKLHPALFSFLQFPFLKLQFKFQLSHAVLLHFPKSLSAPRFPGQSPVSH